MSGWTELLERLTRAAAKEYAENARYRIGTEFGSWAGLAEAIVRKGRMTGAAKKAIRPRVTAVESALKSWARADEHLGKVTKYASEAIQRDAMKKAMTAEQRLVQAIKRTGIERTRGAQLLQRLREVTQGGLGSDAHRAMRAVRQPGGTLELAAVPSRAAAQHIGEYTHDVAGAYPFGRITFSPTRDVPADLSVLGHEFGHHLEQLGRSLPFGRGRPAMERVLGGMRTTAEQIPFRPGGSAIQEAMGLVGGQQAIGRTLPPADLRKALAEVRAAFGTTEFSRAAKNVPPEVKRRLAHAFWERESHGVEEPLADLVSIVLDPTARRALPFQAKASLVRFFPEAFPEIRGAAEVPLQQAIQGRNLQALAAMR